MNEHPERNIQAETGLTNIDFVIYVMPRPPHLRERVFLSVLS